MKSFVDTLKDNRMTLIMSMPKNDAGLCRRAFEAGADVVKVHMNLEHRASGTRFGRLAEEKDCFLQMLAEAKGPMGLVPGGTPADAALDIREAAELGFSFFSVYAHSMPVWGLGCGKPVMAAADYSYSLDEIEAFAACGADVLEASVVPGAEYGSPLTMRDLIRYRGIVSRTALPVVVPTQRFIRPDEVKALAETGAAALMIGSIVTTRDTDTILRTIEAFRSAIDRL